MAATSELDRRVGDADGRCRPSLEARQRDQVSGITVRRDRRDARASGRGEATARGNV